MSEVSFKEQHLFRLHRGLMPPSLLTADTTLPIWNVAATLANSRDPLTLKLFCSSQGDTFDLKCLLNCGWGRRDHSEGYILLISLLKVPHWNVGDILSITLKLEMLNSKTTGGTEGSANINIWREKSSQCSQNIKSKCFYSAAIINMSGSKHFIVQITAMSDWIRWLQYFWELWVVITCGTVFIMNWFLHVNNACWGCKSAGAT